MADALVAVIVSDSILNARFETMMMLSVKPLESSDAGHDEPANTATC